MGKKLPYLFPSNNHRELLTDAFPALCRIAEYVVAREAYRHIGRRWRDHEDIVGDVIGESALLFPYAFDDTKASYATSARITRALFRAARVACRRCSTVSHRRRAMAMKPLTGAELAPEPQERTGPFVDDMLANCSGPVSALGLEIAFHPAKNPIPPLYLKARQEGRSEQFKRRLRILKREVRAALAVLLAK